MGARETNARVRGESRFDAVLDTVGRRPIGAGPIRVRRGGAPADRLVDHEREGDLETHRRAHQGGMASESVVEYGRGVELESTLSRLRALARLHDQTGLLRAVHLVPSRGDGEYPGSWGIDDLEVVCRARELLAADVAIVPSWRLIGAGACQVAVAFGADGWWVPEDDPNDLFHLAASVGREVEEGAL